MKFVPSTTDPNSTMSAPSVRQRRAARPSPRRHAAARPSTVNGPASAWTCQPSSSAPHVFATSWHTALRSRTPPCRQNRSTPPQSHHVGMVERAWNDENASSVAASAVQGSRASRRRASQASAAAAACSSSISSRAARSRAHPLSGNGSVTSLISRRPPLSAPRGVPPRAV